MTETQSTMRAALWMGGSIASFLTMTVAGRAIMPALDVFQVMEMRSVIGWFILLPLVLASGGFAAMHTRRPLQHIGRNVVHYAGQFAWLQALTMIPLAQLISIEFTTPIWGALLAVLFLGERMGARKVAAIVLGLVGVLVIVRPGATAVDPGHLIMLAGAVAFGISVVMVKSLTRTDSVVAIIFWMLIIQSVIGLVPAIAVWRTPAPELWPWIFLVYLHRHVVAFLHGARAVLHRRDRGDADGLPAAAAVGADRLPALQRADRHLHRRRRRADPRREPLQHPTQRAGARTGNVLKSIGPKSGIRVLRPYRCPIKF